MDSAVAMPNLTVDGDRLWQSLMETAQIGGTQKGGIKRLPLTEEDRAVRDWLVRQCEALGCRTAIDEVGNMFFTRPGTDPALDPIAIGSHLDTQPTGGKFDGILGVLAGLEILRSLSESGYATRHPLMLVNWTNEEGARFSPAMLGSGVHAGVFDRAYADARTAADGVTFGDALDAIGYRGETPAGSTKIAAMLELHIEQGPVLERHGKDIGIVEGVQSMRWYDLVITGVEAHAGSTPMDARLDALVAAAELVLLVERIAKSHASAVGTVGCLAVHPSSRNVVPGQISMTVDLRHPEDCQLEIMEATLRREIHARFDGRLTCSLSEIWRSPAVKFDGRCIDAVASGAATAGYSSLRLHSGAGHDSAYIARVAPTSMIFIPCLDGLSHNEAESSTKEQCQAGAQTLLNAVLMLDNSL
ncbi:M20 family metallo-hydrolase [Aminobacter aminovorans]|uniref:M20 family metallo-hydrolase n=1 Tax=Aminobacter aminovorans TaxID=83263 RepID=UPI002863E4B3|nr:M20 family metallo-hydrolase [Aminobacter aminovorans]MDR7223373.1 N-carbamoyl-L-amino-acid hydrolase [Aminobacter aminovorans]